MVSFFGVPQVAGRRSEGQLDFPRAGRFAPARCRFRVPAAGWTAREPLPESGFRPDRYAIKNYARMAKFFRRGLIGPSAYSALREILFFVKSR